MPIHFFTEEPLDFTLEHSEQIRDCISELISAYSFSLDILNYIFCDDAFILDINKKYLNHDYYTDIITFDQSEEDSEHTIEGDIFISIDTVRTNADKFNTDFTEELNRVIFHGLLHLLGLGDKTESEKEDMRSAENKWLKKLKEKL